MQEAAPPARNIELKARCPDIEAARRIAARLAGAPQVFAQRDTFFGVQHGRLKLRQSGSGPAELIWYQRPDSTDPRPSDYRIVQVPEAGALEDALAAALGVRCVVSKSRELYLIDRTRIHLDDVEGLGTFIEFEAVIRPGLDEQQAREQVAELQAAFGVTPEQLIGRSYADLLMAVANRGGNLKIC